MLPNLRWRLLCSFPRRSPTRSVDNRHSNMDSAAPITRLTDALHRAKYAGPLDVAALAKGTPSGFLPLLHFALLGASRRVVAWLADIGSGLTLGMSDARFVEVAHRVLREQFGYKPSLTVQQLLTPSGFADKKMLLVLDVLKACSAKHSALMLAAKSQGAAPGGAASSASPRGPITPRRPTSSAGCLPPAMSRRPAVVSSEQRAAPASPLDVLQRPQRASEPPTYAQPSPWPLSPRGGFRYERVHEPLPLV